MKGLWAGISGIIEGDEGPLARAKREIFEEAGIPEDRLTLLREGSPMKVESQYANHEWQIHPFLFAVDTTSVTLNWENQDYEWITPKELVRYQTVPSLDRVLSSLL